MQLVVGLLSRFWKMLSLLGPAIPDIKEYHMFQLTVAFQAARRAASVWPMGRCGGIIEIRSTPNCQEALLPVQLDMHQLDILEKSPSWQSSYLRMIL